ncbi:virulence RhuM family protein [Salipaludibacillus sp. LMS25]|nr:virulence RhuM family protein [Salipaludibacillus sp. LMS25]UTR16539.1 virulence RhuM family protein [Salipaludibacillus sp. LMS25]
MPNFRLSYFDEFLERIGDIRTAEKASLKNIAIYALENSVYL